MKFFFVLLLLFGLNNSLYAQQPAIYINEFLASNISTNADMVDFGDFSDWIELYNGEDSSVDISGFFITDDLANPTKWQIPANTIIPAKGYYLIWADDFDDIPGQNYIRSWWPSNIRYTTQWSHTNFKLAKEGEEVGLYNTTGELLDTIIYGGQVEDVSYGRKPDGTSNWFYFGEPTPSSSNNTEGITTTEFAKGVLFSQEGGFYDTPISVELSSSNTLGTVRYTLDGSEPTSTSRAYSSAILIESNTTLTARVFEDGKLPGDIFSSTYFIDETRNLPAFSIITERDYLMGKEKGIYRNSLKEREIPINLEYFPINRKRGFSQRVGMRIGGQNIFRFAQKPLNIYANGNYGESQIEYQAFEHLPYQAYKRLYLRNSGDDWPYTMIRDGMIASILRDEVSNSIQAYKPSVLYLNGEYWGIYNLREKLDKQYFSLHYSTAEADLDHLESNASVIEGDNAAYLALLSYASENDLSNSEHYSTVASQIDVHNLMDFVITQSYLANGSWAHNREMWRDRGNENKWRWVLVDMDRGFNDSRIASNELDDIYNELELFRYLTANEDFLNEFVQRYSERIYSTFEQDRVIAIIDSLQTQIEPEIPRHIEKWGAYIDSLTIDEWGQVSGISSVSSWNNEVETFRTFARDRPSNAIQNLKDQFELGEQVELIVSSNLGNQGKVDVNSFFKEIGETGIYFEQVPIKVKAYAPPGYTFKSWTILEGSSPKIDLISKASTWKYYDISSPLKSNWVEASFNDASWASGQGIIGYGDSQTTQIGFGGDAQNKNITAYFRSTFQINDLSSITGLTINLLRDDGAIVYLNGEEVVRSNMPIGTISNSTLASSAVSGNDEETYLVYNIDALNLIEGVNTIAVEVHQSSSNSSDLSFDLELIARLADTDPTSSMYSLNEEIEISLTGNTELIAEFEIESSSFIPSNISETTSLTKSNSPYFVNDNITVESSATLTIEEGVQVLFSEGSSILVKGALNIDGTEEEPIKLQSYYPGEEWGGVFFEDATETSNLNHVLISEAKGIENDENFFAAVSTLNSTVNLKGVHIDHVRLPVSSQFSDLRIENSSISNITLIGDYLNVNGGNLWVLNTVFEGNNIEDMDAIDIGFMEGKTIIDGNIFRDFVGDNTDAIDVGDESKNVQITNNRITNCGDKSVSIGQGSEAYIAFNVFSGCNMGVGIKDAGSHAEIVNNTFYGNNIGVAVYEKVLNRGGGSASIKNSIFGNSNEAAITADEFSSFTVSYSISDTEQLVGTGNLFADPELINPEQGNLYPQITSPVLGTGDPTTPIDGGGRPINIGALDVKGVGEPDLVINEINYHSSNEFDTEDWVEFFNASKSSLDISGWVFIDGSHEQTYVFGDNTVIPTNSFIVVARNLDKFQTFYPDVTIEIDTMTTGLNGSGESLYLYTDTGELVDSLTFTDSSPWPNSADGNGSTLELMNPWLDNGLVENWRASQTNGTPGIQNSNFIVSSENPNNDIPLEIELQQNYPNPFNPSTIINFQIPETSIISLEVFDLLGRKVASLINRETRTSGRYQINFDARELSSGIYIYRLEVSGKVLNKKMTLIK